MKHPIVPLRRPPPPFFQCMLFLLAIKKCSSKYSGFVADAIQKINNLPDKICQYPPLGIKLSYPNDFSHIRYKKTTPFFYLNDKKEEI